MGCRKCPILIVGDASDPRKKKRQGERGRKGKEEEGKEGKRREGAGRRKGR